MRTRLTKRAALWGGTCAVVLAAAAACGAAAAQPGGSPSHAGAGTGATPHPESTPARHTASSSAASPGASQSASGPRPVVNIGRYTGRAPKVIDFSADGGNVVTGIRWLSWTARGATGRGTSAIESCVPDCAQGAVAYVPAAITLSAPFDGKFTVLTETRKGKTLTLRYPVTWPLAAS
ncbi:MAG: hypothetical protein ACRDN0_25605 [Trebonia sp.]